VNALVSLLNEDIMTKQVGYNLTTFGKHSHYNLVTIPFFAEIPIAFSAFKIPLKFTE
jgi:hypothetical protein